MAEEMIRWGEKAAPKGESVPIAAALTYPIRKVTGAHKSANTEDSLVLINRTVYQWDLILQNSSDVTLLRLHYADDKDRGLFNDDPTMFLVEPVDATAYNRVVDAHKAGELKAWIKLKGWYYRLLREFLTLLPSDSKLLANFASPEGPHKDGTVKPTEQTYMDMVSPSKGAGKLKWELTEQPFYIEAECEIGSEIMRFPGTVKPTPPGAVPPAEVNGIKLAAHILLDKISGDVVWDSGVDRLVACDWTSLLQHSPAEKHAAPLEMLQRLFLWQRNVAVYFRNYTNLARGRKMFDDLVEKGQSAFGTSNRKASVLTVRDEIDQRLLTANAFAGVQESPDTEPYQAKLQKLFGSIKKFRVMAAPLSIFRVLRNEEKYSGIDVAHFVLQAGVGHCGEHARLSFQVLSAINDKLKKDPKDSGPLEPLVLAAEANVDHAFVVAGLFVITVIPVELLKKNPHFHGDPKVDKNWFLWNLAEALGGKDKGEICDPYLEKAFPTGQSMLNAIQRKGSKYVLIHDAVQSELEPSIEAKPPGNEALEHLNIRNREKKAKPK